MGRPVDTSRRGVLRWGALALGALAGAAGLGAAVERSGTLAAAVPGKASKLRLSGRGWSLQVQGLRKGVPPSPGDRASVFGELLSGGRKVGEFYSTAVFVAAPLGIGPHAAGYVETHHFNLEEGALLGAGTSRASGQADYAVLGGTGRFAGATGTYSAVQSPLEVGGDGSAEFNFELTLREK